MIGPFNLDQVHQGDCLELMKKLPSESIQTCVTSPPYWALRDYKVDGQVGVEGSPELYIEKITEIFNEVKRVLRDDGTLWINIGDVYANFNPGARDSQRWPKQSRNDHMPKMKRKSGLPHKNLLLLPARVAISLQAQGWIVRSDIIWNKPNAMPESVIGRPSKSHEYIYLMSKSQKYYYDKDSIAVPYKKSTIKRQDDSCVTTSNPDRPVKFKRTLSKTGKRNKRSVWTDSFRPFKGAHFATYPPELIEPCILAGCPEGGIVLDPFSGSGTTGIVALKHNRRFIGYELNPDYFQLSNERIEATRKGLTLKELRAGQESLLHENKAGRMLDGETWDQVPGGLRIKDKG